jgi:hypothetical protein
VQQLRVKRIYDTLFDTEGDIGQLLKRVKALPFLCRGRHPAKYFVDGCFWRDATISQRNFHWGSLPQSPDQHFS